MALCRAITSLPADEECAERNRDEDEHHQSSGQPGPAARVTRAGCNGNGRG
jgi:hypothetical protein